MGKNHLPENCKSIPTPSIEISGSTKRILNRFGGEEMVSNRIYPICIMNDPLGSIPQSPLFANHNERTAKSSTNIEDVLKIKKNLFGTVKKEENLPQCRVKTPASLDYYYTKKDEEKFDLRKTLDKFEQEIFLFKKEKKFLVEENENLKNENAKMAKDMKSTLNSALLQVDLKKNALEEQQHIIFGIRREYKDLQNQYEALESENKLNVSQKEALESKIGDLELRYTDLNSNYA